MKSFSESYKSAGVDVTAGYRSVELMKASIERTRIPGVLGGIGGFGGLFAPDLTGMQEPVFVSGTDGVGTKLKLAFLIGKHDTIGIDCVAMCVNDIVCSGATPLFFLDYLAVGKNQPERVAEIVSGVAEGCVQAGCALIGGETAEMPGFYPVDEYDLAGFSVGMVDRSKMIDGSAQIKEGDALISFASSGLHSNGFSLVRKIFNMNQEKLRFYIDEFGCTLGEELLKPTRIYVKSVLKLRESFTIHGISHITGGGFYENIPRMLPKGMMAKIDKAALVIPPVFATLAQVGNVPERDMFNTYNMGTGLCLAVPAAEADAFVRAASKLGESAKIIGEVVPGEDGVLLS